MPVYRLSYPADIFASIEAPTLDEAKKKLLQVLDPVSDGVIIVLDTPKGWHDPEERLYPRVDGDGLMIDQVSVEDVEGDEDGEDDSDEAAAVEGGPEAAPADPQAGGGEAGTRP